MERISELLDEVGYSPKSSWEDHSYKMFRWMIEATNRIQELEWRVKTLTEILNEKEK